MIRLFALLSVTALLAGCGHLNGDMHASYQVVETEYVEYAPPPPPTYGNQYYNGQPVGQCVRDQYSGNYNRSVSGGMGYLPCNY